MAMIIAKHVLRPSSPTPPALKHHKLSYIDQIAPPFYIPLLFFYKNDESKRPQEISQCLKQSLSETLTIFYPLAGTIKHNSYVDCNDRGSDFVETLVHAHLTQFMQDPKMEDVKILVPEDCSPLKDDVILSVKVSYFDCGGVVVGVCLSHKIADAASFAVFMNAWAANCRGEGSRTIHPSFDLALHFPPKDHLSSASSLLLAITEEKIVTKRLVFDGEKLDKLKKRAATCSEDVKDPSRVEAISVFIWQSLTQAQKRPSSVASHAVNLRPRTVSHVLDHTFGNCLAMSSAVVSRDEDDVRLSRLRTSIRAVDEDYINKVLKADTNFLTQDQIGDVFKAENCVFTSWCRFPVYGVDFGWGKPDWVCTTTVRYMNFIILMSTPSEDGIEAWINTSDDLYQILQANYNEL